MGAEDEDYEDSAQSSPPSGGVDEEEEDEEPEYVVKAKQTGAFKVMLILVNLAFLGVAVIFIYASDAIITDKTIINSVLAKIPGDKLQDKLKDDVVSKTKLQQAGLLFKVVGGVLLVTGMSGALGAFTEMMFLMWIYVLCAMSILLIELVGVYLIITYKATMVASLQTYLNQTIVEKYEGLQIVNGTVSASEEPYSAAWDLMMVSLECCGNYAYTDFGSFAQKWNSMYYHDGQVRNFKVPITCCKTNDRYKLLKDFGNYTKYFLNATQCLMDAAPKYTNQQNCYETIMAQVNKYTSSILVVSAIVAVAQIAALFSAMKIMRRF